MAIKIDQEKCKWQECNSACKEICPVAAIIQQDNKLIIDQDKCVECGACIAYCTHGALNFI